MNNVIKHLHKINKHRYYVCKNCFKAKQYKRGLLHDLSKYSPTEFLESIKYYQGNSSPINKCKEVNGYSKAWQHHKGRNPHHWEYWIDNINNGYPEAILMPYEYAIEMLCDYIGAGQAYQGKEWTPQKEYQWWNNKKNNVLMHPQIFIFINTILSKMAIDKNKNNYTEYLYSKFLKMIWHHSKVVCRDIPNHYRPKGEHK